MSASEVAPNATLSVVVDIRSVPFAKLGVKNESAIRNFGIGTFSTKRHRYWQFIEQSGVYPIVDQALQENVGLPPMQVVEARAARMLVEKGSDANWQNGHELLEWADHLAYEVMDAERTKKALPTWVGSLLAPPGVRVHYDAHLERLLSLARGSARGGAVQAIVELSKRPDACTDEQLGGLADRCRARIVEWYEARVRSRVVLAFRCTSKIEGCAFRGALDIAGRR